MSVTNYGELKAAVAAQAARSDKTGMIPDFITAAHFNLMNGLMGQNKNWIIPPLRIIDMLETDTLTPSGGEATLAANCLGVRKVTSNTANAGALKYVPPQQFDSMPMRLDGGVPDFYTVDGRTLKIAPFNGNALYVRQYEMIAEPSADGDTNAIFDNCPHAYVFAAMGELYDQIRAHERAQWYFAKAGGAVAAANRTAQNSELGEDQLVARPPVIV